MNDTPFSGLTRSARPARNAPCWFQPQPGQRLSPLKVREAESLDNDALGVRQGAEHCLPRHVGELAPQRICGGLQLSQPGFDGRILVARLRTAVTSWT